MSPNLCPFVISPMPGRNVDVIRCIFLSSSTLVPTRTVFSSTILTMRIILIVKMVDEKTVLVGTNVDEDKKMQRITSTFRPGIGEMTKGHKLGDILAKVDLDPYFRSFRDSSTHVLARNLDEPTIRTALKAGHAFVAHDW